MVKSSTFMILLAFSGAVINGAPLSRRDPDQTGVHTELGDSGGEGFIGNPNGSGQFQNDPKQFLPQFPQAAPTPPGCPGSPVVGGQTSPPGGNVAPPPDKPQGQSAEVKPYHD